MWFLFFLADVRTVFNVLVLAYQIFFLAFHREGSYLFPFLVLMSSLDTLFYLQARISCNSYIPRLPFIRTVDREDLKPVALQHNVQMLSRFFPNYLITSIPFQLYTGYNFVMGLICVVHSQTDNGPYELKGSTLLIGTLSLLMLLRLGYTNRHNTWPNWTKGQDFFYYRRSTDISVWVKPNWDPVPT